MYHAGRKRIGGWKIKMKNMKLALKISSIVIFILTLGLMGLWQAVNIKVSSLMKAQILTEMEEAVKTRCEIVEQYVQSAEAYVIGYAQALELKEALLRPEDSGAVADAQHFTENYARVNKNLENVYLADYGTTVLASYVTAPIGRTLREGEGLRQLRDEVFDSHEIWNVGIMESLSTGRQVVSLYYPIFEGEEPLGYVGGAIYSEDLRDTLNHLSETDGDSQTEYMLLDAAAGTYIFCAAEDRIGTDIGEDRIREVMELAKAGDGFYEYRQDGREMMAVYRYMPERDWVFAALLDGETAYAPIRKLTVVLLGICLAILLGISLCVWGAGKLIAGDIVKVSRIIKEIGTLDLTLKDKLDGYVFRRDEVGMMAKATLYLADAVSGAVRLIKEKNAEVMETSGTLRSGVNVAGDAVEIVENAVSEIAGSATKQAGDTQQATQCVLHIGEIIEKTMDETERLNANTGSLRQTSDEMRSTVQALSGANRDTEKAMEEIGARILSTNEFAGTIKAFSQLIAEIAERTNLLSLNASIEAARAGEQGRGFAVVAGEIQKLAEQSNHSAKQIDHMISTLLSESGRAVDTMTGVKGVLSEQSRQLSHTEELFMKIYREFEVVNQSVASIYDSVRSMDRERLAVVEIVQNLSCIAEENAAGTQETLASTELVKGMVKDIMDVSERLFAAYGEMEKSVGGFLV